ncbi:MAG TPA: alpha/beta hydrolase, partial [Sphingomonas sp.]|nr:alpha/beta hydrolase [Sphingomonas sp.]
MEIEHNGGIAFERGGEGDALLVLIHGLAATARVWSPMLEQAPRRWPGRWIAPDLRGHGGSAPGASYAVADYAADIARLIEKSATASVTLLGHSMGGVIALALAGQLKADRVFGLGIKVAWTDAELERLTAVSQRPPKLFAEEAEAREQHRRQCGLECDAASPLLERGTVREGDQWRTVLDQRAFAVSRPPMAELLAAASCPVHLTCGEHDVMVSVEQLRALDPNARRFDG